MFFVTPTHTQQVCKSVKTGFACSLTVFNMKLSFSTKKFLFCVCELYFNTVCSEQALGEEAEEEEVAEEEVSDKVLLETVLF